VADSREILIKLGAKESPLKCHQYSTRVLGCGGVLHETLVSLSQMTSWDKGSGEQFRIKSSRGKYMQAAEIDYHTYGFGQGGTIT